MKINLLFFASLRESLETNREEIDLPDQITNVGDLRQWLLARGPAWEAALGQGQAVRVAVNQALAEADTALTPGAEVAFFPPVTGG
ncbi:MAG: molybdopterin converting factor subunit 1 [Burkholderiaceae bacterium]